MGEVSDLTEILACLDSQCCILAAVVFLLGCTDREAERQSSALEEAERKCTGGEGEAPTV